MGAYPEPEYRRAIAIPARPDRQLPARLAMITVMVDVARDHGGHWRIPGVWRTRSGTPFLSERAARRRLYRLAQDAHTCRRTAWADGLPPALPADLTDFLSVSDRPAIEVEQVEDTPHSPHESGAVSVALLPRGPKPKDTPNRVCSADTREDLRRRWHY